MKTKPISAAGMVTLVLLLGAGIALAAFLLTRRSESTLPQSPAQATSTALGPQSEKTLRLVNALREHTNTLGVTITLSPVGPGHKDQKPGLRSLFFHTGDVFIEPHAFWSPGNPVSADVQISAEEILRIVDALARAGVLETAGAYHSPKLATIPPPPPPESSPGIPPGPMDRHVEIRIDFSTDAYWHRALIAFLPWAPPARALLEDIHRVLTGEAARWTQRLIQEMATAH